MKAFWHPAHAEHAPEFFLQRGQFRRNFEIAARAEALLDGCRALGLDLSVPPDADMRTILAVHRQNYLDFLRDGPGAWAALGDVGPELVPSLHPTPEMLADGARPPDNPAGLTGWYAADGACPIGPGTWAASLGAAACAVAAAEEAAQGRHAYAVCRPPGHHAYAARAGGHCYLNNAAIAAERLRAHGAARVGVLDIDAHHGNGTQHIFWHRDDVLFASIHGDTRHYYPWFTGTAEERGAGAGQNATLNCPLSRGSADAAWLDSVDAALAFLDRARCDALVISLGFDAADCEPLHFLSVSDAGFASAGQRIAALRRPTVLVQEGGYAVDHLGRLLGCFIEGFGRA